MNELFWLIMLAVIISMLFDKKDVPNIYPKPKKNADSGPGLSSYPPDL